MSVPEFNFWVLSKGQTLLKNLKKVNVEIDINLEKVERVTRLFYYLFIIPVYYKQN